MILLISFILYLAGYREPRLYVNEEGELIDINERHYH
jgi:hypothetical protein